MEQATTISLASLGGETMGTRWSARLYARAGTDLGQQLQEAIDRLPANITGAAVRQQQPVSTGAASTGPGPDVHLDTPIYSHYLRPDGSVPPLTENVYGAVPPTAVSAWLYAVPAVPRGRGLFTERRVPGRPRLMRLFW